MRGTSVINTELSNLKPPGFSLNNYEQTRTLDPASWHFNIVRRMGIYWYLIELYPHLKLDDKPIQAKLLCGSPERRLRLHKELQQNNIDSGFELKQHDNQGCTPELGFNAIRSLKVEDLINMRRLVKGNEYNIKTNKLADVNEYLDKSTRLYDIHAVVNLNTPDDILVKQFTEWVKVERSKHQMSPVISTRNSITPAKMRRWHDKRIIPYLDLIQWHQLNGQKIKKHHIAQIIFPDEINRNPVDIINKSTEPLIKEIYSDETKYALYIQGLV